MSTCLQEGLSEFVLNVHITLKITSDTVVVGGAQLGEVTRLAHQHQSSVFNTKKNTFFSNNKFSWWFSLKTGEENVCDMFCFGHGAAALCVFFLSPGWPADTACWFWLPHSLYPVGTVSHRSGHTRSCRLPPTAPPLTLGLSTAICRCELIVRLNAKLIYAFLCEQFFILFF